MSRGLTSPTLEQDRVRWVGPFKVEDVLCYFPPDSTRWIMMSPTAVPYQGIIVELSLG